MYYLQMWFLLCYLIRKTLDSSGIKCPQNISSSGFIIIKILVDESILSNESSGMAIS